MKIGKQTERIFLVLCLTLGAWSGVNGQTPEPYTLRDILTRALENNHSIVKAKYDYEEGEARTREVRSAALPQVNINADFTDNVIQQAFVFPAMLGDPNAGPDDYAVLRAGMKYSTSVSAQATQTLFNKSVFTGIKAAEVSEEFYSQQIARTEEEVIRQVANLFYRTAALQAQKTVLASSLEQTAKNLEITRARYENGLARKLDADRLKVAITNLQTQIRSVDDAHANLLNQLKLVAGIDMAASITLEEPVLEQSESYVYAPAAITHDWSWQNKIEHKLLNTQLKLYDLERKNYSAGFFPVLSAYANYTYTGQSNQFLLSSEASPLWFDVASVGLRLSIPVFDGLNKSAKVQQSRIRRMKTERDLKFTEQQSDMEFRNALKSFETSYASYLAQKDNVDLAHSVYDVTLENFNEGLSPLTDLLQAEQSRIQAQSQLIESLISVRQAEVALLSARGEVKTLINQEQTQP